MARLASIAVGGYFPTPFHLVDLIAEHFEAPTEPQYSSIAVVDPCAGAGAAIMRLSLLLGCKTEIYACELEKTRHEELQSALRKGANYQAAQRALHGDAFAVNFSNQHFDLLYLNPPYDLDPVHGRLEERFLDRYTASLTEDGVLVFVVPYYALAASAKTLAFHYDDVECYRFPDEDFDSFKQVVLFARKRSPRLIACPDIYSKVMAWASQIDYILPTLGHPISKYSVRPNRHWKTTWELKELDYKGLIGKAKVWKQTSRMGTLTSVPHILPEIPVEDLLFRSYPLATPARPAHIASGIASGLFNGRQVSSETPGLPDLLVKGVFDREYKTIEEKQNKDGEVTSLVQVQQPKLVTTILDLERNEYHTLKTSGRSPTPLKVDTLTIEDLLEHYGPSLMGIMESQCPVLYDPRKDSAAVPLPETTRKLFTAQSHAAKALLRLLGGAQASRSTRKGRSAILLGEIGSGKTTVALTVGKAFAKRMLVMCPPHLLDSWTNEVASVCPEAEVRILREVSDVMALADEPADKLIVAVLSRESAKLGHGWEGVPHVCPKCGAAVPAGDLAKKRATCEAPLRWGPKDAIAQAAVRLAYKLAPFAPKNATIEALLRSRFQSRYLSKVAARDASTTLEAEALDPGINALLAKDDITDGQRKALVRLLLANYRPERIVESVRKFHGVNNWETSSFARELITLLEPNSEIQNELLAELSQKRSYWSNNETWQIRQSSEENGFKGKIGHVKWTDGKLTLSEKEPNTIDMALRGLSHLASAGSYSRSEECGEPLFQAIPQPRRVALSRFICKHYPGLFDFLVLDEGHEYATDGSAQERSAHRLTSLGLPTVLMTGSIMNGYAESLFTNMWALSADFRAEFDRDERQRFIDRYGYRKRLLTEKQKETGEVVSFGSVTDRVERSERVIGDAPGVLPLFLFRHLLRISVTLHKADLAIDLPKCHQIKCDIHPDADLKQAYESLKRDLTAQIKKDRFKEGLAGKLFGALAELPSYLDRSTLDTGNQDDGSYEIRYPESLDRELVARGKSFDASALSAKEQWMVDTVKAELAEGRNVMVFGWHVSLLPRLARLIKEHTGEEAPILYANKVATAKRQAWIDTNIVKKKRRVMIANPVAIQTGLNNLVHFSTELWFENPACNPIVFRQAVGRVDRIGQKHETRIYLPVYKGTMQELLHDLLLRKVAVSVSTDGLDPESALLAAGVSEDGYLSGLSIGKQLWNMLNEEIDEAA